MDTLGLFLVHALYMYVSLFFYSEVWHQVRKLAKNE